MGQTSTRFAIGANPRDYVEIAVADVCSRKATGEFR